MPLPTLADYHEPNIYMRIGRYAETEKLYRLEEQEHKLVKACAEEAAKFHQYDLPNEFWTHALPQALYDLLESFDHKASIVAARTFLAKEGYTVTAPSEDK